MQNYKAKVRILDSFKITGLEGLTVAFEKIEGDFTYGDKVMFCLESESYQLKIKGIDISTPHLNPNKGGFLLEVNKMEFQKLYKNPKLQNLIVEIM